MRLATAERGYGLPSLAALNSPSWGNSRLDGLELTVNENSRLVVAPSPSRPQLALARPQLT